MKFGSENCMRKYVAAAATLTFISPFALGSASPAFADSNHLIADSWTPGQTGKQTAETDREEFTPMHPGFDAGSVSNSPTNSSQPGPFQGQGKGDREASAVKNKQSPEVGLFAPPQKAQSAPVSPPADKSVTAPGSGGSSANLNSTANSSSSNGNATTGGSAPGTGTGSAPSNSPRPFGGDNYPSVGRMERLTFGSSASDASIEERLGKLETAIFKKTFSDLTLFDRTQQLKSTLLGNDDEPTADLDNLRLQNPGNNWQNPMNVDPLTTVPTSEVDYFGGIAQRPENQQRTTLEDMKNFALELINSERAKSGLGPLQIDPVAEKIASEQSEELCKRGIISHANLKGENPDRRYTLGGGTGALTESIVSNKTPDTLSQTPTRGAIAEIMRTMMTRQDDRDSILNPDATHIGFAINWSANKERLLAVTEIVTSHGIIPEIPNEVGLGEKLEIKGVVQQPYQFDRITLAWEANKALVAAADDADEALPYFPPLDYVAYAVKSGKDYSGAMTALRTAGVIAAIAGGVFVPPVALAAPLIAMSGGVGNGDPKPVSDIPIHGGVKVEGLTFNSRIPINKDGKEGIYYVTIWGTIVKGQKPVPISRRAIIAKHVDEDVSARIEPSSGSDADGDKNDKNNKDDKKGKSDKKDKSDKKEKHHKNK